MMAITTNNSMSVKPFDEEEWCGFFISAISNSDTISGYGQLNFRKIKRRQGTSLLLLDIESTCIFHTSFRLLEHAQQRKFRALADILVHLDARCEVA